MNVQKQDLFRLAIEATKVGSSYSIISGQEKIAKELVEEGKCYWSIDYNRIASYSLRAD